MTKKEIAMVDFWSVCDDSNNPIGHGPKVGNEYYSIIKDNFKVRQYANKCILPYLVNNEKIPLKYSLTNTVAKVKRIIRNFLSLYDIYKREQTIWFYVPDIYLFLFLLIIPKRNHKYIVNIYEEYITNNIKHMIFRASLKKIDVKFVTNKNLCKGITGGVFIPDYPYLDTIYGKYRGLEKKDQIVCLGTMNHKKKLYDAVQVFKENQYQLIIIGKFTDIGLYESLCKLKTDNIVIENRFVETDEYYELIASSNYCLLPYDEVFYKNRTSGVIQECIFLDTIPVAPKSMLTFSGITGVGYSDFREIEDYDFYNNTTKDKIDEYKELINREYKLDSIKNQIISSLYKLF